MHREVGRRYISLNFVDRIVFFFVSSSVLFQFVTFPILVAVCGISLVVFLVYLFFGIVHFSSSSFFLVTFYKLFLHRSLLKIKSRDKQTKKMQNRRNARTNVDTNNRKNGERTIQANGKHKVLDIQKEPSRVRRHCERARRTRFIYRSSYHSTKFCVCFVVLLSVL